MAKSAEVLEDTVTDVRDLLGNEQREMSRQVEFRVGRRFKGAEADTATVITAACGYGFELGGTYLVYAGEPDGQLSVSLCRHTMRIDDDLAALWRRSASGSRCDQLLSKGYL
jgi:hypothetical protein